MQLSDTFWQSYELDFQEIKIAYLNWAIGYAKKPKEKYRHLFLRDHQENYCLINSQYGRAFSISPFGVGVRGVPRTRIKGIAKGLMELKNRLSYNTQQIKKTISKAIDCDDIETARNAVLNYFCIKIGIHEIYFDRIQYEHKDDNSRKIKKGRFNFLKHENYNSLTGIRNKIINTIRFGDILETPYVKALNKKLPGFSKNSFNTFLSGSMTWNRYGLCAFDCGPVVWSKKGFVHFNQVQAQMEKICWPYHGTASKLLKPLYTIALNYKRPPLRIRDDPNEGYSLKSMRDRKRQINEILGQISKQIHHRRQTLKKS